MPKCIDCNKKQLISGKLGLCEDCIIKYMFELENHIDELENEIEREAYDDYDDDYDDDRSAIGE